MNQIGYLSDPVLEYISTPAAQNEGTELSSRLHSRLALCSEGATVLRTFLPAGHRRYPGTCPHDATRTVLEAVNKTWVLFFSVSYLISTTLRDSSRDEYLIFIMPRQKRPLSEADANATNPPTKRASKGSTSATDENAASPGKDYESMTNRQLSDLLKARGLKHNWNSKEVLIMALRDSDAGNPKIFRINQPSAKRDATAATANDYDSMTKMELSDLLKARGLLYSGPNKAALIQRLREAGSGSGQVAVTVVPAPAPVPGLDFVTMCRPHDDVAMEKKDKRVINEDGFEGGESAGGYDLADVEDEVESDEDEEEEGHANIPENRAPDGKCMCRKPAKDFPEWKWVISKRGLEIMMLDLMKEFWKRDQDAHGDYNCNDWTGYGVQEVMENQASPSSIWFTLALTDLAACHRQGYRKERRVRALAAH